MSIIKFLCSFERIFGEFVNEFVEFLKYEVLKILENKILFLLFLDLILLQQLRENIFSTQIDSRLKIWVAIQFKTDLARRIWPSRRSLSFHQARRTRTSSSCLQLRRVSIILRVVWENAVKCTYQY